jgi:polysaccharide export outer membrane protein
VRGILLLALALVQVSEAPAPEPPPPPAPAAEATPSPAPEYQVGVGDVLDVIVFDNPDLTRATPIRTNGTISLPLLGDIEVAGLTVPEVERRLTVLLERDYLVNPQVEVRVKEYNSQFVFVVGEVAQTGRIPLKGRTRLIDLLAEAGGLTQRASGEILIARADGTFDDGEKSLKVKLGGRGLTPEEQAGLEVVLRNGDILTASPKYYVTVEGEVARPGRIVLEPGLTASAAISSAGGLTRFGGSKIKVRRFDAQTGETQILEVNLKDVRDGKEPDLELQANDVVSASRKVF